MLLFPRSLVGIIVLLAITEAAAAGTSLHNQSNLAQTFEIIMPDGTRVRGTNSQDYAGHGQVHQPIPSAADIASPHPFWPFTQIKRAQHYTFPALTALLLTGILMRGWIAWHHWFIDHPRRTCAWYKTMALIPAASVTAPHDVLRTHLMQRYPDTPLCDAVTCMLRELDDEERHGQYFSAYLAGAQQVHATLPRLIILSQLLDFILPYNTALHDKVSRNTYVVALTRQLLAEILQTAGTKTTDDRRIF